MRKERLWYNRKGLGVGKKMQKDNNLLQPYLVYLESIRSREENFIKFLGIILPAIGGIIYIFKNPPCFQIALLSLILITLALLWAVFYSISNSYTQRYLQIELDILEKRLDIPHPSEWSVTKWREKWKSLPWWRMILCDWHLLPENQKMHVRGIFLIIFFSWIGWAILFQKGWGAILLVIVIVLKIIRGFFLISRKYEIRLVKMVIKSKKEGLLKEENRIKRHRLY
ncbi:hypothetical protein J7L87_02315, partial [bacterium]|nr:hypothetical protein [bacterium]